MALSAGSLAYRGADQPGHARPHAIGADDEPRRQSDGGAGGVRAHTPMDAAVVGPQDAGDGDPGADRRACRRGAGDDAVEHVPPRRDQVVHAGLRLDGTDSPSPSEHDLPDGRRAAGQHRVQQAPLASCTTPPRAIPWVDTVSLGIRSRSTSVTP